MESRYAPREVEKVVAATFTYAPRQLRWLADTSKATGMSKAQVLRRAIDAAIRGEVATFEKTEAA